MKVQQISQQLEKNEKQNPQFKGAVDTAMRYLATNQAVGATALTLHSW